MMHNEILFYEKLKEVVRDVFYSSLSKIPWVVKRQVNCENHSWDHSQRGYL